MLCGVPWGWPTLPTLLMMSSPARRSNFSCWNHRFIVLCCAVNQRDKDPIRPDPDISSLSAVQSTTAPPHHLPLGQPSSNQSNPVNSCHPLSKSKRFKYISPSFWEQKRGIIAVLFGRYEWKIVGKKRAAGKGGGAANTNCTFQPELHDTVCVCVCVGWLVGWLFLFSSKSECLGQIKKSQQNYLPVMKFASILFSSFLIFLFWIFFFSSIADAKRFAILFFILSPSEKKEVSEECKVFMCFGCCFLFFFLLQSFGALILLLCMYNLNLQSVGRLPLHQIIGGQTLGQFITLLGSQK